MKKNESITPQVKSGKLMDLTSAFGFREVFGSEANKELVIRLLNQLFKGEKAIVDLRREDITRLNSGPKFGSVTLLFQCVTKNDENLFVEMQLINEPHTKDIAFYQASKLLNNLTRHCINSDIDCPDVYYIEIMNTCFSNLTPASFLSDFRYRYDDAPFNALSDHFALIFLALPLFTLESGELKTELDQWAYLLKNMHTLDKIPAGVDQSIFGKLFDVAAISHLSKSAHLQYQKSLLDKQNDMDLPVIPTKDASDNVQDSR